MSLSMVFVFKENFDINTPVAVPVRLYKFVHQEGTIKSFIAEAWKISQQNMEMFWKWPLQYLYTLHSHTFCASNSNKTPTKYVTIKRQ